MDDLSKEEKNLLLSTYEDNGVLTFDRSTEDRQKLKLIVSLLKKGLLDDSPSAGTASRMIVTRLTVKARLLCEEIRSTTDAPNTAS